MVEMMQAERRLAPFIEAVRAERWEEAASHLEKVPRDLTPPPPLPLPLTLTLTLTLTLISRRCRGTNAPHRGCSCSRRAPTS